jgi:A/G-specific adenine glycosylase
MLQQTRVETVVSYWNRWMTEFPSLETLAAASPDDVNQLWAGLGYYRRGQNLLKGAKFVVENYDGEMPQTREKLLGIPGIGPYTAGAILSIAFRQREAVVDGNVLRVFSRLFALYDKIGGGKMEKVCWKLAEELVDPEFPADFNQAVMELGATVCTPTSPKCSDCPVRELCAAYRLVHRNEPSTDKALVSIDLPAVSTVDIENLPLPLAVTEFPFKKEKKKARELSFLVVVLRKKMMKEESKKEAAWQYLMVRRPDSGLLANQWEFPSLNIPEGDVTSEVDECQSNDMNASTILTEFRNEKVTRDMRAGCSQKIYGCLIRHQPWQDFFEFLQLRTGYCVVDSLRSSSDVQSVLQQQLCITQGSFVPEPIVHIFSHERHSMFVAVLDVIDNELVAQQNPKNCAWRSEQEMTVSGLTTGVKKVLMAAIRQENENVSNKITPSIKVSSKSTLETAKKRSSREIHKASNENDSITVKKRAKKEVVVEMMPNIGKNSLAKFLYKTVSTATESDIAISNPTIEVIDLSS